VTGMAELDPQLAGNIVEEQQLQREISHWRLAASRLKNIEMLTSPSSWRFLEFSTANQIRSSLNSAVDRLITMGNQFEHNQANHYALLNLEQQRHLLNRFRKQYLRTEITINLYTDALNTRAHKKMGLLLSAYDGLARKSMQLILRPLGYSTPPVLTYIDSGQGASIAKAGMKLWDGGTINPCAVIKVVLHNLYRNTSLIHESGHQVAHITHWNGELAELLNDGLKGYSNEIADVWSSWSSEIAADAFGFVHTGYASVAGLHDVVSGDAKSAFRFIQGDPHPINYLRVLLAIQMCSHYFGRGSWDNMKLAWMNRNPLSLATTETRKLIKASLPLLDSIVKLILTTKMTAFKNRSLDYWLDPMKVHPDALKMFAREQGKMVFNSNFWMDKEPMKLLAILSLNQHKKNDFESVSQENWLMRMGSHRFAQTTNSHFRSN